MTPEEEFVNRLMKAISEDKEERCEIDSEEGSEINDSLMICINDCWYEVSDIVFPNLQRDITRIQLLTCIYNLPDVREKRAIGFRAKGTADFRRKRNSHFFLALD